MSRGTVYGWAVLVLTMAGCSVQPNLPAEYPLSDYKRNELLGANEPAEFLDVKPEAQQKIGAILTKYFGTPDQPGMPRQFMSMTEEDSIFEGAELYRVNCIHCHGLNGGGNGPTAPFLFPRPRDYRRGTFKWKSTTRNAKPTREDLASIIKNGAVGTSMPPFKLMPEKYIDDLVNYVIFLSKRGELERRLLQAYVGEGELPNDEGVVELVNEINASWAGAGEAQVSPDQSRMSLAEDSPEYEKSIQNGKQLYLSEKAACYKCHGPDGLADPEKMAEAERKQNVDDWGNINYPRNLRLNMFRGGRRPIDLYRRIHQGVAGASMPAGGNNLKSNEIWDLVSFVRAIPYRPDLLPLPQPPAPHGHGHGDAHSSSDAHGSTPAHAEPQHGESPQAEKVKGSH